MTYLLAIINVGDNLSRFSKMQYSYDLNLVLLNSVQYVCTVKSFDLLKIKGEIY